jgi:hypothetical protein
MGLIVADEPTQVECTYGSCEVARFLQIGVVRTCTAGREHNRSSE